MIVLKRLYILFFFLVFAIIFNACSIDKRHYRHGFYVNWNTRDVDAAPLLGSDEQDESVTPVSIPLLNESDSIYISGDSKPENAVVVNELVPEERKKAVTIYNSQPQPVPPDELPPGNDKPNKKNCWLIAAGFVFVGCILFAQIASPAWVVVLCLLAPLVGVGFYLLARRRRNKILDAVNSGAKGDQYVLSAHYHRFKLLMQMFFIFAGVASVFLLLANYTTIASSGIAGAFASVLISGSTLLMASLAAILFILFLIYLFHWRKDPTGYAPPRERHPRKDG